MLSKMVPGNEGSLISRLATFLLLAATGLTIFAVRIKLHEPVIDFQQFYIVGLMIRHSDGPKIYDFAAQADYQQRFVDPSRAVTTPDLPFLYPAATALLYLPLTWLPLNAAWTVWMALNLILLLIAVRKLQSALDLPHDEWPLVVALLFAPVIDCLWIGQLSIILLLLYTTAFVCMQRNRDFVAGLAVGLVALKPQLMVGFVLILGLRRCWKAVTGAVVGASVIAALTAAVVGWRGLLAYPEFLRQSAYHRHVGMPMIMVNVRGILWLLTGIEPRVWLVAALSMLVIAAAACSWKGAKRGFAFAVIATVLTAYHAYAQELTLFLIPLAAAADGFSWTRGRAIAILLLAPIVTFGLYAAGAETLMGVLCALLIIVFFKAKDSVVRVEQRERVIE